MYNSKFKIQDFKGMTLIEVLIAIFVFGVGILSIITLMSKNINTTQKIHTQNTALILAREGMEMAYNYRDTNNILGYDRNCGQITLEGQGNEQSATCTSYRGSGDTPYWIIDSNKGGQKIYTQPLQSNDNFTSLWSGGRLFLHTHHEENPQYENYGHQDDGTPTIYSRYLFFTGLSDIPIGSPIHTNDILVIKSIVLYDQGGYTGQISLSSFIASPE